MTEIKPVYQVRQLGEWIEVDKNIFDELYIQNKFPHRILYPAAAYEALQKENVELKEDLQFVERWASHHGTKPNVTAQEALSCIQHYPSIAAITKSYKDGVIPNTRNPYAEIEAQAKRIAELETPLTDAQIASACLSHRHDFGLLTDFQRISIFNTAKSLEECFRKERELSASKNGE